MVARLHPLVPQRHVQPVHPVLALQDKEPESVRQPRLTFLRPGLLLVALVLLLLVAGLVLRTTHDSPRARHTRDVPLPLDPLAAPHQLTLVVLALLLLVAHLLP